jgi:helicase
MRVDTLEAYNVAHDILAIWRERVGEDLLPVQERAVKEFGLFGDANLIVFSTTSSAKTFIGEMAAVRAARGNTKVFYLVPQKALAEEKELRARYQGVGIDVVVSSRDRRDIDDFIVAGLPKHNRRSDTTGDLARVIGCLQEVSERLLAP